MGRLKLATLHFTMANGNSDSIFLAFLSALVKWLLGMIILSLDLRSGCHYMARFDPDQDLGLFRLKQHWPH